MSGPIAAARRAEDARAALHARDAARSQGVGWSGLGPGPLKRRSPDALARGAAAAYAALQAWRASRTGTMNAALARAQALARAAHTAAEAAQAALARAPDATCAGPLGELHAHAIALRSAAEAAMDAAGLPALSGGPCATNTASSRPSTASPRSSAG